MLSFVLYLSRMEKCEVVWITRHGRDATPIRALGTENRGLVEDHNNHDAEKHKPHRSRSDYFQMRGDTYVGAVVRVAGLAGVRAVNCRDGCRRGHE